LEEGFFYALIEEKSVFFLIKITYMLQKITLALLFVTYNCVSFAQSSFKNSLDDKVQELKQYVLKDYKNLKQFYPTIDCFEIGIEIDSDSKTLLELTLSGYEDTNRIDSIAFWAPFEQEIKRIFYFNPSIEDDAAALFNYSMFRIELNEEVLKSEIKVAKNMLANKCKYMIKPNAKFSISLNELTCKPFMKEDRVDSLPKRKIKSQLRGLKSDVFQLAENYFIYFQAKVATSDEHCPCELTAYIYFVNEEVSDLLSSPAVQNSNTPIFKLKERSSWKNEHSELPEEGFFRVDMDLKFK